METKIDIPKQAFLAIQRYCKKQPIGNFMEAFLSNDLWSAIRRADPENVMHFKEIFDYLLTYIPNYVIWGSKDAFELWYKLPHEYTFTSCEHCKNQNTCLFAEWGKEEGYTICSRFVALAPLFARIKN